MAKYSRITGKVFGSSATATGDDPEIGQFGSALAGTYNGTTDVATIQSLPAWNNGFIGCVTPNTQFPPLPEMTGFGKVLSHQICYLLQQGIAEWDSGTTYYIGNWCSYNGSLYISKADENLNNLPTDTTKWTKFTGESPRNLGEYVTSSLPLTDTKLHLADGSLLSSSDYPEFVSYVESIYNSIPESDFSEAVQNTELGSHSWREAIFANNKFIALSSTGYISTSIDGVTWTTATQNANLGENSWRSLASNGSTIVALGKDGYISTSSDGTTWTTATQNANLGTTGVGSWVKIIYASGGFIALSNRGYISTSTNGTTWITAFSSLVGSSNWDTLTYNGSLFFALDGTGLIATSSNGVDWAVATTLSGNYTWTDLLYFDNNLIALSLDGYISTSTDGTTWTTPAQNVNLGSNSWNSLTTNGQDLLALGSTGYISIKTPPSVNIFIDEAEWQTINTTYGECGKYVYNAGAGTVRIPSVNSFFKNTVSTSDLGDLTPASIPNVKGTFSGVGQAFHSPSWPATLTGDFYRVNTTNNPADGAPIQTGGSVQNDDVFGLDASRGSSVYSDSATTVNPQSIKQLVYIVVAK